MKIYFLNGNIQKIERHYLEKEYRDDVIVEINDLFYEVYFFTKDALTYEMTKDGFFAFPGLIILDKILTESICKAIVALAEKGYFKKFKGFDNLLERRFMNNWYENELQSYDTSNMKTIQID